MENNLIPFVIEHTSRGERGYDLFSRLLKDRIIFLSTPINDYVSSIVVGQMMFLDAESKKDPIKFYINSPGGSVSAGLAIYDTMQYIGCPVETYCIGKAASMASVLLMAGQSGSRFILPNAKVMIHQPLGGTEGQAADIEIYTKEMLKTRDNLYKIMSKHCGKPVEQIKSDCERDNWMDADQAKEYNIIDEIVS